MCCQLYLSKLFEISLKCQNETKSIKTRRLLERLNSLKLKTFFVSWHQNRSRRKKWVHIFFWYFCKNDVLMGTIFDFLARIWNFSTYLSSFTFENPYLERMQTSRIFYIEFCAITVGWICNFAESKEFYDIGCKKYWPIWTKMHNFKKT